MIRAGGATRLWRRGYSGAIVVVVVVVVVVAHHLDGRRARQARRSTGDRTRATEAAPLTLAQRARTTEDVASTTSPLHTLHCLLARGRCAVHAASGILLREFIEFLTAAVVHKVLLLLVSASAAASKFPSAAVSVGERGSLSLQQQCVLPPLLFLRLQLSHGGHARRIEVRTATGAIVTTARSEEEHTEDQGEEEAHRVKEDRVGSLLLCTEHQTRMAQLQKVQQQLAEIVTPQNVGWLDGDEESLCSAHQAEQEQLKGRIRRAVRSVVSDAD
jgi:hypothetical protein